jgi:phosphohistidine phosphatase SixA
MDLFILRYGTAGMSSGWPDNAARGLTRDGKEEIKQSSTADKNNKIQV